MWSPCSGPQTWNSRLRQGNGEAGRLNFSLQRGGGAFSLRRGYGLTGRLNIRHRSEGMGRQTYRDSIGLARALCPCARHLNRSSRHAIERRIPVQKLCHKRVILDFPFVSCSMRTALSRFACVSAFPSVLVFTGMIEVYGLVFTYSCRPPRQLPQLMPCLDR